MTWRHVNVAAAVGLAAFLLNATPVFSQSAPSLGTAQSYAVLAAATVTNTGSTTVNGDLGLSPNTASSVTGFPPGIVTNGTIQAGNAAALQARNDAIAAYNNLAAQGCTSTLTGDLGGRTLTPGVYCFTSSAQLTGTLTLDAQGNPAAVFILKIGTALTTASNSLVSVINSGQNCNVFWQIGSSATLGTDTTFAGNILAAVSITLNTRARVSGRTFAGNDGLPTGAVTLDTNTVDRFACAGTACPPITLAPATLPSPTVGVAYNQTLTASGGTAPYTFTVRTGALPAGLTLSPAGVLSGTPSTAGTSTFTVRATGANGCFAERSFTVVVAPAGCPTITIPLTSLPVPALGVAYNQTLTASGGTAPYTFTVTSGALPTGLTLTPAGVLSGTPTAGGTFTFTVQATDANGCFATRSFTVTVLPAGCPAIALSPATLPNATQGVAYTQTITGSGGTAPYTFTVITGTLPAGLTLTPAGVLAGTPTTAGATTFTIRGTDANGCFAELTYTFTVVAAVPTLSQWAMIVLTLLLALAGYAAMRRRTA